MNMPGFSAEAAVFNVNRYYQATAESVTYGGTVQPAGNGVTFPSPPFPCIKRICIPDPVRFFKCNWYYTIGFWNRATGRCE